MKRAGQMALLALVAGIVAASVPVAARPGKVVRVERPRFDSSKRIRLCVQPKPGPNELLCVGAPPPARGAVIHLLDMMGGIIDRARVVATGPSNERNCQSDQVSAVTFDPLHVGSAARRPGPGVFAIIGFDIDPARGTMKMADGDENLPLREQEELFITIDANGDKRADLAVTHRKCQLAPPSGTRASGEGQCLSYWVGGDGAWTINNEDVFYDCD